MQEAIRRLREMDPKAAAEMERQLEQMSRAMARQRPGLEREAESVAAQVGKGLSGQISKLRAELDAMSPSERAAPAFVGGADAPRGSLTLLSSPGSLGSRALVAENLEYFDSDAADDRPQLLIVELRSSADHAPEQTIIVGLREAVDWGAFWAWVR